MRNSFPLRFIFNVKFLCDILFHKCGEQVNMSAEQSGTRFWKTRYRGSRSHTEVFG